MSKSPYTEQEKKVNDSIIEAHEQFMKLHADGQGHPMEMQEWVSAIHQLQSILEHRILKRLYPTEFK